MQQRLAVGCGYDTGLTRRPSTVATTSQASSLPFTQHSGSRLLCVELPHRLLSMLSAESVPPRNCTTTWQQPCSEHPVDPGAVGLALSYALEITTALMYTVKTSSEIENSLVAVERVLNNTAIPPEAPLKSSPSTAPLPSWPTAGAIEIQHYSTRYRGSARCTGA